MQVLFLYTVLSFASDIILINHNSVEYRTLTLIIRSLFTILEFFLFSFFINALLKNKLFKKILLVCNIIFAGFAVFQYFINFSSNQISDSLSEAAECIILMVFCIVYFYEQINKPELILIYESYSFWAISGIFLYLAGGLFVYIFEEKIPKVEKHLYWNIIYTVNITRNIFFSIAFSMKKEKLTYSPRALSWN
jgi:hypothetical protein